MADLEEKIVNAFEEKTMVWCHKFFELSLATTIMMLKPVSCDHVTSFDYDDKKARDVGLTC